MPDFLSLLFMLCLKHSFTFSTQSQHQPLQKKKEYFITDNLKLSVVKKDSRN